MPELYWNNFKMGQRRDAALREDALLSARELNNFDIDYDGESADLVIRPGYTIWNDTELSGPAQQIYPFVDMEQNFNLLGIASARWRAIKSTGSHVTLVDEAATATRPIEAFGNRVFFGTDTDAYWTDDASIDTANPSFRMGIEKPLGAPSVQLSSSEGRTTYAINWASPPGPNLELNTTNYLQIGSKYTPANDVSVATVWIPAAYIAGTIVSTGQVRLSIRSDSGGLPDAVISGNARSTWITITALDENQEMYIEFNLYDIIDLTAGVDYWITIESDDDYKANYTAAAPYFYIAFGWANDPTSAARYAGASWVASALAFPYVINGLDPTHWHDYEYTYANETYNSESRPSEKSIRIKPIITTNQVLVSFHVSADPQIETVNVYRRDIGTDEFVKEDDIVSYFLWSGSGDMIAGYTDNTPPDQIGARLHSEDHYLYDEADDTNQGKRAAFIPAGFVLWKGRIWAWTGDSNKLYLTKTFERDNPMGLVGESSPDYFPLDNVMDFPVPSGIINAKPMSNDQLAVYFRNEQIWIVSGGDSILNPPPPGDIARRPTYQSIGLFAPDAVVPYTGSNIYLAREGLYRFTGIGSFVPELLSETQTGIFDDVENQYFRNCKLVSYGREVWILLDSDNDGTLDKILILDLERDFNTRGMVDRAWRGRTYPVAMTDLAVHSTGDVFREILAADAVDGWIMKLNDGDTDNGAAIVGTAESHDIRAPHNAFIYQLLIQPYYNDEDNIPDYDLTVTSAAGDTFQIPLTGGVDITGNEDIRGHTIGLRMKRAISVRLKVVMTSTKRDVIRGFTISYGGE
jgi:hypothetical protein